MESDITYNTGSESNKTLCRWKLIWFFNGLDRHDNEPSFYKFFFR